MAKTILSAEVHNFMGIEHLECNLPMKALISGKNAVGKSSFRNAIIWVPSGKLADGSTPTNIKRHDKDGNPIHHQETYAEIKVDNDGVPITLRRTVSEKWVLHRGEKEPTYEGDVYSYKVDGIDKSQKEFTAICNDIFPEMALLYGSNAHAFLTLDAKKRRNVLLSAVSGSDDNFIDSDEKFAEIMPQMRYNTAEECVLSHKRKIKELETKIQREDAAIETLKENNDEIGDMTLEDLQHQLESYQEGLNQTRERQRMVRGWQTNLLTMRSHEIDIKRKMDECVAQFNSDVIEKRKALNADLVGNQSKMNDLRFELKTVQNDLKTLDGNFQKVSETKVKWQTAKFDESQTICPTCGQSLPEDRITDLRKTFSDKVNAQLAECDKYLAGCLSALSQKRHDVVSLEKKIIDLERSTAVITEELQHLPEGNAIPNTDEYQNLQADLVSTRKQIEAAEAEDYESQLLVIEETARNDIRAIDKINDMIEQYQSDRSLKRQIESHQDEIEILRDEIGEELRQIDLLEEYQRAKIDALTESVNSHFRVIKWEMFKTHKDGSTELACEPMVNGTSYYRGLNHGDRLLAEIDVCQAFQRASGVEMFVTLDDAESVDPDRIPVLDNQMLVFRRTDDEQLSITEF